MASTSSPNSAASEFFVNVVDNTFLDAPISSPPSPGYAVFGHVTSSNLAVIDVMKAVTTHTVGGYSNVPVTNIVLQTAAQTQ